MRDPGQKVTHKFGSLKGWNCRYIKASFSHFEDASG
jgi:hypothetical protein